MTARERLFDAGHAFDHPVTVWICVVLGVVLLVAPVLTVVLARLGLVGETVRKDVLRRWKTWVILAPAMVGPILLGAAWVVGATCLLALACYAEFARATGMFRNRLVSFVVVLGILATMASVIDNWYGLFVAVWPLSCGLVAAAALFPDQPRGYLQRTALGVLALSLFAGGLGHFAFVSNDTLYRPILLWLVVGVQANDVFAYLCGKAFGRRKLCPRTSPNKTLGGALGALVLTTALMVWIGGFVFEGTGMASMPALVGAGLLVSITGQLGDLVVSSVKRDLDIKDMGTILPGHGGLLDRFDSLLLAAPALFHYIGYLRPGFGLDQTIRVISGP